ncbi:MAG: T9SS C-terminal target domain-containing protein, partial [Bacteroidetes bacterium]|nr:T9SS C-terminal target domain-containing protein [Bacteroidota bacterium]
ITLIRNGEVNSPIILNQFYESALDDYTRGEIRYPFFLLDPGRYQLNMKVWDVHNNSSTHAISFVVVDAERLLVSRLFNYPNPFSNQTTFQFDHNRPGEPLEVGIDVYNTLGRRVKSIRSNIQTEGYSDNSITWDGLDDYGNFIGNGVYVYHLWLRTANGESASESQKLVILR